MRAGSLGRLLRFRNVPPVLVHASLGEPCLCGILRPVILLPERWLATAHRESVDAVLAHELAHARRRDHLVNLGQRVLEILPRIQELVGMTPNRPRFLAWPCAAFVSAVVLALATASIEFFQPASEAEERLFFTVAGTALTDNADEARQICYEVRFVDTEPDAWREALPGIIKLFPNSGRRGGGQWVLDKPSFDRLDQSLIARPTSRTVCAPKTTAFETARIGITARANRGRQIGHNTTIWLGGTILNASILMTVDLTESMHTAPTDEPLAPNEKIGLRIKDFYSIPKDSSLVLSLGRNMKFLGGRNVPSERLIVITPRQIILTGDEPR